WLPGFPACPTLGAAPRLLPPRSSGPEPFPEDEPAWIAGCPAGAVSIPMSLMPCPDSYGPRRASDAPSTPTIPTVNAKSAANTIGAAAVAATRRDIGERSSTLAAVRLPDRIDGPALGAQDFFGDLPALQVGLDLPAGEVAVVDVLGQVNLEK